MNKQEYIDTAEQELLHTYNRFSLVLDHGEGVYLYDTDKKAYLDFAAGIAVCALGYSNEAYKNALKDQVDKLLHTSNLYYNVPTIEAAKKATGLDPVEVGTYRGFTMSVTLEDFGKKYVLTMQGRLKHQAILGSDPRGNLIRLDNALAQMPQRLQAFQTSLEETYHQQEAAKAELGKPFPFEEELRDKTARLIFLDAELNLDANKGGQTEQVIAKSARPSVLDKLRSQPAPIRNNQKQKRHEEVR